MATLSGYGIATPLSIPVTDDGLAIVSSLHLSMRFHFSESSLYVEKEIFDDLTTSDPSHTVIQEPFETTGISSVWKLEAGKYCVYGLFESHVPGTAGYVTPRQSSNCTIQTPPLPKVKIEPGTEKVLSSSSTQHLQSRSASFIALSSDSSDDDVVTVRIPGQSFVSMSHCEPSSAATHLDSLTLSEPSAPSIGKMVGGSILECLKKLSARPGNKNILKKLNYEVVKSVRVDHLPPVFDGDILFEFPPVSIATAHSSAKSMQGMDKRYDGHLWTKTMTTNISNDMGLAFRSSLCVGHLRCANKDCDYLKRAHRTSSVNDTEFEGSTWKPFSVGQQPPKDSTLVCRVCKEPPKCVKDCCGRIFYVHGGANMTRACIHLGHHRHPVKVGDYRDTKLRINTLIGEQIEKTPSATKSAIVLEASKELVGEYLLGDENEPPKPFNLEELLPVLDRFKDMGSPSIRNKVVTFRYLRRYGVMDSITKLRGLSNWAFVQKNMFPGQGEDSDKVFVFKMSEIGPASGVDLVKRMQPGGDLESSWIMFDHVKRVKHWTTMACHVYDSTYCRVMTIACCDMQSEDKDAQVVFWKNLNAVMERHDVPHPQFMGFMADSAQANWNAVRIIYGNGNPADRMEDRERTCFFHWSQSLEKHNKQYIAEEFRDQHKRLCMQYRDSTTMAEAETRYLAIRAWWVSSGAASETSLRSLDLWLAFWHFRYRQWGGFMQLVSTYCNPYFSILCTCIVLESTF